MSACKASGVSQTAFGDGMVECRPMMKQVFAGRTNRSKWSKVILVSARLRGFIPAPTLASHSGSPALVVTGA
jgi:adenine/guanine phosphoribosyltransferase-like PRPP-binding protein